MNEALTPLLTALTMIVEEAFGWVATAAEAVVSSPILVLMAVGVPLVGLGVGLFKRLASNL